MNEWERKMYKGMNWKGRRRKECTGNEGEKGMYGIGERIKGWDGMGWN